MLIILTLTITAQNQQNKNTPPKHKPYYKNYYCFNKQYFVPPKTTKTES